MLYQLQFQEQGINTFLKLDIYVYNAPAEDINVNITINNVLEYN